MGDALTTPAKVGWTVETLRAWAETRLDESDRRYQQRFDAQQKALEAAALAAEKAVQAALAAAKEAVLAASISAEKSVQAALAAAEKAIDKAESAQTRHNLMQNEWRATVSDVTKTVAETARHEATAMTEALEAKTALSIKSVTDKLDEAVKRLDRGDGRNTVLSILAAAVVAITVAVMSNVLTGHAVPAAVPQQIR